ATVDEVEAEPGERALRELAHHRRRRLERRLLRLLDERIDDVRLPARRDLVADAGGHALAPGLAGELRADGRPAWWELVGRRGREVAVEREGERPRDRRRAHDEHVELRAGVGLPLERGALQHAEAMLLVDDREPEPVERDALLDEGVGT